MKFILLHLILLLFVHSQNTGDKEIVFQTSGMKHILVKSVEYKTGLKADLYYSSINKKTSKPVIIFITGLYDSVQKDTKHYVSWAKLVASEGFIGVNYEINTFIDPSNDFKHLLEYLDTHSETLKLDIENIAIWSCSAIASMALSILENDNEQRIKSSVFYYSVFPEPENVSNTTQKLIVRAGKDSDRINNSIDNYVDFLKSSDAKFTFINYKDGQHVFDLYNDSDESKRVIIQTIDFFKRTLN